MQGRKPIPNEIKRLRGDGIHDSAGRRIAQEPQGAPGVPEAPAHLSDAARAAYEQYCHDLQAMRVLTLADRHALALLAQLTARAIEAEAQIDQTGGMVREFNNGEIGKNAWLKIWQELSGQVTKTLLEFGLTPCSRSRIKVDPAPAVEDDFAELEVRGAA